MSGKIILEVGHGENIGLALKFLAVGAGKVVCIDKFHAPRDEQKEYEIYQGLRSTLNQEEKDRFDECIDLKSGKFILNPEKIECFYGVGIEDALAKFNPEYFDLIYSNAVLEHIDDIDKAMDIMPQLLAPGGSMVHSIDFKDHGMFSSHKLHPLTFLSISNPIYRYMTAPGYPNRKLIQFYKKKMEATGDSFKLLVSQVYHEESLLADRGREMPSNLDKNEQSSNGYATLATYKENIQLGVDFSPEIIEYFELYRKELSVDFYDMAVEDLVAACVLLIVEKQEIRPV